MADLSYDVRVNTRDAVSSINGLKTALGGLAVGFATGGVVRFADSITSLRNKLLTLTPDIAVVNKQFNALAAIAITSRAPLEATGDLFFRIQRSAKALGISTQEAATITDSLAKAMSASGLSAGEAAGPLLQLGQALQSGVFQGDELRSILEGMPVVAQALADELRVPVGALKQLGSEGQISADVFVRAMRKARDSIDDAFGRTTPTITSAIEGLRTNAKLAFDEFEKNTQTGRNLAASIEYLGFMFFKLTRNIDEFAATFTAILKWTAITLAFIVVGKVLLSVVGIIKALGVAVFAVGKFFVDFYQRANKLGEAAAKLVGPLKAIADVIVAVTGAVLGSAIGALVKKFNEAKNAVSGFFDKVTSAGDATSDSAKELEEYRAELAKMKAGLDDTATAGENAANIIKQVGMATARAALDSRTETDNLERSLKQAQQRLAVENQFLAANKERITISQDDIDIGKQATDIDIDRSNAIQAIRDNLAKLNLEYSQLAVKDGLRGKELAGQIGVLKQQITSTGEIYDRHTVGMTRLLRNNQNLKVLEEDRKRTQENITKSLQDQFDRQQKLTDLLVSASDKRVDLRFDLSLRGLSPLRKQLAEIEESSRKAALEAGRSFAAAFEDSGDGITPEKAQELADGLDKIAKSYRGIADEQIKATRASQDYVTGFQGITDPVLKSLAEFREEFKLGSQDAFLSFKKDVNDAGKQAASSFSNFTSGMEDAFVSFVQTGKLSFKSLANSIIADLVRIAVRRAIVAAVGGPLGMLFGGGRSAGGSVAGGTSYVVGERGPELFVPQTAGKIISNSALKGSGAAPSSGGGQTVVNYNIQAVDASSFRSLVAKDPSFIYAVTEQGRRSQPTRSR
jgi:lambda family phage tail tape measure protein